jgi:hypothetical protein
MAKLPVCPRSDDEFAEAGGYATHFMVSFLRFLAQSRR